MQHQFYSIHRPFKGIPHVQVLPRLSHPSLMAFNDLKVSPKVEALHLYKLINPNPNPILLPLLPRLL